MKRRSLLLLILIGAVFSCPAAGRAYVANILGNPGFENDLGIGANWNNDANRGINVITAADAPEGKRYLRLDEALLAVGTAGAFTFQVQYGVTGGDLVCFSGLVRANIIAGGHIPQMRIEFKDANDALLDSIDKPINAVSANFQFQSLSKRAPLGTTTIVFVLRIQPAGVGGTTQVDFDVMKGTINGYPVSLNAGTTGGSQNPGDAVIISTQVLNVGADALNNVQLVASLPQGGLTISKNYAKMDNQDLGQREGSVIFALGNLASGQQSLFGFGAVVNSGATTGKRYAVDLFARLTDGTVLSDVVRVYVVVERDPLFNLGTIIGKVFDDRNGNGAQDCGEKGIPNVRLATEQGVVVYTDRHGKYHIPGVVPGRHLVKADAHSLPEGTQFVTEESYLVKITDGLLAKVNFAVKLPENEIPEEYRKVLTAQVIQELDRVKPELALDMNPAVLRAGQGILEKPVVFQPRTNYAPLLKEWKIEVRDELGNEIWSGLGRGAPPGEVQWDGLDNGGALIEPGDYAVRLVVTDTKDREDWTPLRFFRVESKLDRWKNTSEAKPFSSVGFFNIMSDGKRSIPFSGITSLRVQGQTAGKNQVLVNKQKVQTDKDGFFETSLLVPNGVQKVEVTTTTESGEAISYQKDLEVKENYYFMVGLGEEALGAQSYKGAVESANDEPTFRDGFYHEGRLAYYLKGKIKGKFLITSSYDTEKSNRKSKLFTNLDPDKYYPVYGDASQLNYDAGETQDGFYVLIEKDKSFLKWGSFNTDFTDTELATHNRTMSGGKVHFETLKTTRYGNAKSGFSGFYSKQKQEADHNEFQGTGGSLYYLRNRRVIEGSEKIFVEVRDKLTGIVRSKSQLSSGTDYEINYDQGRIILARPLFSITKSDTVINQNILEGDSNVLVVDYEYEAPNMLQYQNAGLRGVQHFSDFVRIGATYIENKRPPNKANYDMPAVDATIHAGKNTKITAEYAESQNNQLQGVYSADGGMTFRQMGTPDGVSEKNRNGAYVIRLQSKPFKPMDFSLYAQKYNPWFNNANTSFSQADARKYGLEGNYRITPFLTVRYRNDNITQVKQAQFVNEFNHLKYHTAQIIYDDSKFTGLVEYRHGDVNLPDANQTQASLFYTNNFRDAFGGKLGYRINENYMPYIRGQATFNDGGKADNQAGVGIEAKVLEKSRIMVEENFGNIGDSTQVRIETQVANDTTGYANIKMGDRADYGKGMQTTLGTSHNLDAHSRLFTEKELSGYQGANYARNIVGYERSFFDNRLGTSFTMERSDIDRSKQAGVDFIDIPILNNAFGFGLTYQEKDFLKAQSRWEYRRFTVNSNAAWQWLVYNNLGIKITEDLEFFTRYNMSKSRDLTQANVWADFTEFNTGFSYRPVCLDRLNFLTRYTYLSDALPADRFGGSLPFETSSHIAALEGVYDLNRYFQMVEKVAFKLSKVTTAFGGGLNVYNYLMVNRLNYHVTRKWDLGAEYRLLTQQGAIANYRHGVLVELDREIMDYTRIGVGYNFTDFDDDLRHRNYENFGLGPFVRLTGKF